MGILDYSKYGNNEILVTDKIPNIYTINPSMDTDIINNIRMTSSSANLLLSALHQKCV